ncbi:MAG: NUDIX hydrolase, partial [Rickettsiales bacterium]|nr:NUDIX hydrolase [Rickettsiales bacterium]
IEKEIFERKDAVGIVLHDKDKDKFLLLQQFRPGSYIKKGIAYPFEIVAGLIDKTEDMEGVIKKEVLEEANCEVKNIYKICSFFPEISFSTREIHLFYGNFDSSIIGEFAGLRSESESTKLSLFSRDEILFMIKSNKIINSHSLIGLMRTLNFKQ